MKKAQMEILGLAIVVVLIVLASLFVVRFVLLKEPDDFRGDFVQSQTASNMINTFLKTTAVDCSKISMTELLQDCARGEGICCLNCYDGDTLNDVYSCQFVQDAAAEVFSETLDVWKMKYYFLAYDDQTNPEIELGSACKGAKKSKTFPLPIDGGTMFVKLDICG
jgi:hypothetical protein